MISIFGEQTMMLNSKLKKRPRNFYESNVAGLRVFQTDSVLKQWDQQENEREWEKESEREGGIEI